MSVWRWREARLDECRLALRRSRIEWTFRRNSDQSASNSTDLGLAALSSRSAVSLILWLRKLRKYLNRTSSPMQGRVLGVSYGESPLANLMAAAGTYVASDIAERHMTTVGLMPPSRRLVAPVRSAIPTSRGVQRTKQFA